MASSSAKKGGKKIGRGMRSPAHNRYVMEGRSAKNKARDLRKHIKRQTVDGVCNDKCAVQALKRI